MTKCVAVYQYKETTTFSERNLEIIEKVIKQKRAQADVAKEYGISPGRIFTIIQKYKQFQPALSPEEVIIRMKTGEEVLVEHLPLDRGTRNAIRRSIFFGGSATLRLLIQSYKEGYDFTKIKNVGTSKQTQLFEMLEYFMKELDE